MSLPELEESMALLSLNDYPFQREPGLFKFTTEPEGFEREMNLFSQVEQTSQSCAMQLCNDGVPSADLDQQLARLSVGQQPSVPMQHHNTCFSTPTTRGDFEYFQFLPWELRNKIWQDAMANNPIFDLSPSPMMVTAPQMTLTRVMTGSEQARIQVAESCAEAQRAFDSLARKQQIIHWQGKRIWPMPMNKNLGSIKRLCAAFPAMTQIYSTSYPSAFKNCEIIPCPQRCESAKPELVVPVADCGRNICFLDKPEWGRHPNQRTKTRPRWIDDGGVWSQVPEFIQHVAMVVDPPDSWWQGPSLIMLHSECIYLAKEFPAVKTIILVFRAEGWKWNDDGTDMIWSSSIGFLDSRPGKERDRIMRAIDRVDCVTEEVPFGDPDMDARLAWARPMWAALPEAVKGKITFLQYDNLRKMRPGETQRRRISAGGLLKW